MSNRLDSRIKLRNKLNAILGDDVKLYYQPPSNIVISYPCLIYNLSRVNTRNAENKVFFKYDEYNLKLIDRNPDSGYKDLLLMNLPYVTHVSHYVSDNLYHDVFTVYYLN